MICGGSGTCAGSSARPPHEALIAEYARAEMQGQPEFLTSWDGLWRRHLPVQLVIGL